MPAGEWVPPLPLGLHLTLVHSQTTWRTFLKGKSLHLQGYMGHSRSLPGWPGPQGEEDKGVSQLYHEQLCHLECPPKHFDILVYTMQIASWNTQDYYGDEGSLHPAQRLE